MNNNASAIMKFMETARTSFNSQKVNPDSSSSFASLLTKLHQTNKALSAGYARIEETEIELLKTYSKQVAGEKIADIKKEYAIQVKTSKEKLYSDLDKIINAKRSAIEHYVTIVPPDELVKLIQTVQFRLQAGGKIGDNEWNMIVRRVTDSGNYMAMSMLNDLAITMDRDFTLPFDVDFFLSELEDARTVLKSQIDNIDTQEKDWNYSQFVFLSDKPNEIKDRYIAFDSIHGVSVPEKELTWRERLMKSAQSALNAGDSELFNETYRFIADNRSQLMSAEEAKQDVLTRAEELYNKGMSAGEK